MKTRFFGTLGLGFLVGLTTGVLLSEPAATVDITPEKKTGSTSFPGYEHHSIEEVLANPTHKEPVKITGEIISKVKCGTYLFRGDSGDIHIRIEPHAIPEQGIPFREATVINGIVNHHEDGLPIIEANQVHYIF